MNQDILYISFLLGVKEKAFQLLLKSYSRKEAAGQTIGHIYELDVSSLYFPEFYFFVRKKYGVLYEGEEVVATKLLIPDKAVIEQKKGEPWEHLLIVYDDLRMEKIIFYPDECQRENEEEDVEYQEDVKRANLIKSLVTTLPEEYRDTGINEKPLDKLIRLTEEADLYKYDKNYQE